MMKRKNRGGKKKEIDVTARKNQQVKKPHSVDFFHV